MLFYLLMPTLAVGVGLAVLFRCARKMDWPFSLLNEVPVKLLDERIDSGVYVGSAVMTTNAVFFTAVQISMWPSSQRYLLLNGVLLSAYVVPLALFARGVWSREVASRVSAASHLSFMCVASWASGEDSVMRVMFESFAFPVVFGHFAVLSSEPFAFLLLVSAALYLGLVDVLKLHCVDPWFHYSSMTADSQLLPFTMALTNLVQLTTKRLSVVYKTQRLAEHFLQLNKSKDDFVRTVTHEIKSPLHGITACAQLLNQSDALLTQEQREQVSVINHSSAVLNLLVDNVLNKGHDGLRNVRRERIHLRPFFAELFTHLKHLVYQQSSLFSLVVARDLPVSAIVPRVTLTQVLLNLGLNAVKHAGGGEIEVHVAVKGTELLCEVRDRGPGVKNEELLFSGVPEECATSGTGIGLSVCKAMCDAAGCRLSYRPNGHCGSVFYVAVSLEEAEGTAREAWDKGKEAEEPRRAAAENERMAMRPLMRPPAAISGGSQFDLLVVDDSKVNLKVMRSLLERCAVERGRIFFTEDGAGALSFFLQRVSKGNTVPLLVLMDIQMPKLDGNEAARHWRQLEESTGLAEQRSYIVAVSAGHQSTVEQGHFDATLEKPVMFAALNGAIAEGAAMLAKQRAAKEQHTASSGGGG